MKTIALKTGPAQAVQVAAQDALANEAPVVARTLVGIHRSNAITRRVLRRAAHYAALAGVEERALVEYLKGKLL